MPKQIYVSVKDLPSALRKVLEVVGCNLRDISISATEMVSLQAAGGEGYKHFVAIVNLSSGEHKVTWGSWGGANPFNSNPVDRDSNFYRIPANGAVVRGYIGGSENVCRASIEVAPETMVPMLPLAEELSERARTILRLVKSYTSAGRKQEFEGMKVQASEIDELVSKGLLKRNKAQAISITTTGKNAAEKH